MSRNDKILRSLKALSGRIDDNSDPFGSFPDFYAYFKEFPDVIAASLFLKNVPDGICNFIAGFGLSDAELSETSGLISEPRYNRYNNDGHPSNPAKFISLNKKRFPVLSNCNGRTSILVFRNINDQRIILVLRTKKNVRFNKSELDYFSFLVKFLAGNAHTRNRREKGYHLFDKLPSPVAVLTLNGEVFGINYFNPAFGKLCAEAGFKAYTKLFEELLSAVTPYRDLISELNKAGESEITNFHPAGAKNLNLEFNFSKLPGGNEILCRITDNTWINDLKKSYNLTLSRIGALIENMRSGILLEDETRRLVVTNPEFCAMFGIKENPEDLIGRDYSELISEIRGLFFDQDYFLSLSSSLVNEGKVSGGHELRLEDGRFFVLEYIPVFLDDNYAGHLWHFTDATKAKHDLDELTKAKLTAEESVKAKEMFFAHVSHEIRTPMNAITGLASLMLQTELTPKQSEYVTGIKKSSDNLLVIINDILDFSKINAGKVELEFSDFPTEAVLDQIRYIMLPAAESKNLKLEIKKSNEVPPVIIGDRVRIGQILLNLVGNAVKFTEKGSVILTVSAVSRGNDSATIRFEVSDTGAGIPEDQLENIFSTFSQVGTNFSARRMGTGLGLGITRSLVNMHGGSISVKSEVHKGSVFTVDLPFRVSNRTADSFGEELTRIEPKALPGKRALVAEDNEFNRLVVTTYLDLWGAEYDAAQNGKICVELARTNIYDFILMDLGMPELDGYEAAKMIRSLPDPRLKQIPIIALTASAEKETKQRILSCGMNDYISKPVKPGDLLKKILFNLDPGIQYFDSSAKDDKIGDPEHSDNLYFNKMIFQKYVGDDKEFSIEVLERFLGQADKGFIDIEKALDQKKTDELQVLLHRLKSPFGYLGIKILHETLTKMEDTSLNSGDLDTLREDYNRCIRIWPDAKAEVAEELEKLKDQLL